MARRDARAPLWRYSDRCTPADVYEARLGLEGYITLGGHPHRADGGGAATRLPPLSCDCAFQAEDVIAPCRKGYGLHDPHLRIVRRPNPSAAMYRPVREILVENPASSSRPT